VLAHAHYLKQKCVRTRAWFRSPQLNLGLGSEITSILSGYAHYGSGVGTSNLKVARSSRAAGANMWRCLAPPPLLIGGCLPHEPELDHLRCSYWGMCISFSPWLTLSSVTSGRKIFGDSVSQWQICLSTCKSNETFAGTKPAAPDLNGSCLW